MRSTDEVGALGVLHTRSLDMPASVSQSNVSTNEMTVHLLDASDTLRSERPAAVPRTRRSLR